MDQEKRDKRIVYGLVAISVIFLAANIYLFGKYLFKTLPRKTTVPTPAPFVDNSNLKKNTLPMPQGKQTYQFSHGKDVKGPKVQTLTIDPLIPGPNVTQTVEILATHDKPITKVSVAMISDNNKIEHKLNLSEGDDKNGKWTGSWEVNESFVYKNGIELILSDGVDTYDNVMWIGKQ